MRRCLNVIAVVAVSTSAVFLAVCGQSTPTTPNASHASSSAPASAATYTVSGLVADLAGSHPIANATISVTAGANTGLSATSDANGRYVLAGIPAGSVTLEASASGYNSASDTIDVPSETQANFRLPPNAPPAAAGPAGRCDPSLWPHMHDVQRIHVVTPCETVSGTVAVVRTDDDGDYDIELAVDPAYASLLNAANVNKLSGYLNVEAICQTTVHPDVPDAMRTCANFTGTVPIPPVGAHVQVTGVYVLDTDHGWMEIHPISVLTVLR